MLAAQIRQLGPISVDKTVSAVETLNEDDGDGEGEAEGVPRPPCFTLSFAPAAAFAGTGSDGGTTTSEPTRNFGAMHQERPQLAWQERMQSRVSAP
jgi:hypothetical protein